MAGFLKGKVFLLLLLLLFNLSLFVALVTCNNNEIESPPQQEHEHEEQLLVENEQKGEEIEIEIDQQPLPLEVLDRQELQLQMLETLVKNLTEAVARLESLDCRNRHKGTPVVGSVDNNKRNKDVAVEVVSPDREYDVNDGFVDVGFFDDEEITDSRVGKRGQSDGVSVTKYNPSWSERFQFLSAVKLESEATCINILPFEDYEGFSKYIAVGDERGRVYIFLLNGDVLVEFHTNSESPITSMLSYLSVHKNESVLVTGHKDGVVLVHRVWEASSGEDWHSLSMKHLRAFPPIEEGEENSSPVTILEVHQVGRMRYILSSDLNGRIRVLRENGTVYGNATTKSQPLAFMRQRLLFLTETGAGSLDLRSMTIRESECEGLNRSLARNYVFDSSERSKGYGVTSEGELIHVVLLGDMMNFKCRVRSKKKFEMDGPLSIQAIKGYLLVVNQEKVFVYNVSSQNYIRVGVPRALFHASLGEIRSSFLNSQSNGDGSKGRRMIPLIASDHEKLVVLGLGTGYVGMYRSNLPVYNPEFNTMLWTSPVLLFFLFLFGVWQFFGKKKESLTSWGSDDPFISAPVTVGASLASGSGERPFADSTSRATDLRDIRGGALRGPTRRYGSPSRYPGGTGAAMPFRTSAADSNFRTSSTDHNFRATTELKYRAPNLEGTGFAKRREPLFSNSQVVEDNIE